MNRQAFLLIVAAAALGTRTGGGAEAEDFLQHRWYRLEIIVFEQSPAVAAREGFSVDGIAARERLLDTVRYPNDGFGLAETSRDPAAGLAFGPPPPVDTGLPLLISNLPPPPWYTGPCGTALWNPPIYRWLHPFEMPPPIPRDPCLAPEPWQLERDGMEQAMYQRVLSPQSPPDVESLDIEERKSEVDDPRQAAMDALVIGFSEYEDHLLRSSYVWERATPKFAVQRATLAQRYEVIAAGSWHQPVPPRDEPQPLVVQVGAMDDARRYPLEGWFSVTLGRFIHLRVLLEYRLPDNRIALIAEQRRMRSDEPHYLDHPAIGILARVDPVPLPDDLARLLDELEELDQ